MTRIFHYFIVLMVLLTLTSCATTTGNPSGGRQTLESYTPPEGAGVIYLYRDQFVASSRTIKWAIDDKKMGDLPGKSFSRITLPAGKYNFKMVCPKDFSNAMIEKDLEIQAGKVYYVKHEIHTFVNCRLNLLDESVALSEIEKIKPSKHVVITKEQTEKNKIKDELITEQGKSVLVIYNDSNVGNSISLSINSSPIAALRHNYYLNLKLEPGQYEIQSDGGMAKLAIDVKPNQIHFVRQEVTVFGGRNMGILPGTKLFISDQESFDIFKKDLPILLAEVDLKLKPKDLFYLEDGATYQGEFQHDYPSGKGVILYSDPNHPIERYEGDVVPIGSYKGEGTITQRDGTVYSGKVSMNKPNGKGTYTLSNGSYWESTYKDNSPFGFSTVKFSDGSSYEGELKNWKFHGKGVLISDRGRLDGIFKEGNFYSGKALIDGKIVNFSNGKAINYDQEFRSNDSQFLTDFFKFALQATNVLLQSYNRSLTSRNNAINSELRASSDSLNSSKYQDSVNNSHSYISASCTSDFNCGVGSTCVKRQYSTDGVCMRTVDRNGVRVFNTPDTNSIGVKTTKGCYYDAECPVGFKCDQQLQACVRP